MKLISSREAVTFLSQIAPRPWVQRLLRWMAFDDEIRAFASKGQVLAHSSVYHYIAELVEEAGEHAGPKMDALIKERYPEEFAEKLYGKDRYTDISEETHSWNDPEDPERVAPGFFLYATSIEWDTGSLSVDWFEAHGSFAEAIFLDGEMFGTDFEEPHFSAEFEGLSFSFQEIELLLPQIELRPSSGFVAEARERNAPLGRPAKWNWEGALAHVISQAQTPDGLPTGQGAQARIEEMISSWFVAETGNCPASSQVRQRASTIMRTLEKKPESPKGH